MKPLFRIRFRALYRSYSDIYAFALGHVESSKVLSVLRFGDMNVCGGKNRKGLGEVRKLANFNVADQKLTPTRSGFTGWTV